MINGIINQRYIILVCKKIIFVLIKNDNKIFMSSSYSQFFI